MDLFTDRAPSAAEDFIEETRDVWLPGTKGRDGQPLVVRIRRLPPARIYTMKEETKPGGDPVAERLDEYRAWAREAIVEPTFSFNGEGSGPSWDRLPMAAQMAVAGAIAAFTTEGTEEVTRLLSSFRGGQPGGGAAGDAGGGPASAGENGAGEPAASAYGLDAASGGGARGGPRRARRRSQV